MLEDVWTALNFMTLSPLSLADKRDWSDSREKYALAKNPTEVGGTATLA